MRFIQRGPTLRGHHGRKALGHSAGDARRRSRWSLWQSAALTVCLLLSIAVGCNRAHYRRQADEQAFALIGEKTNNALWDLQDYEIYVDPRSRMFDPFDPDVPPLPPDDPAAHELMHDVYGMKGYPGWHYSGETPFVENPSWYDYLPADEQGVVRLNSRLAHQLGRLHSRNYQAELEELYLSALDVSFERFRFDSQVFAGYQLFSSWDGRNRRAGGGESRTLFTPATNSAGRSPNSWTIQKSFATGGDFVAGFANSLLWQFSGPNDYSSVTLFDFSLVQPLLRGAGRDRILERLTLAERTLLANVRGMQRYRGAFYVELMTGRNAQATDGPQRRGGVLGGSGLDGFSGVGAGGFGRLATTGAGGTGGVGNTGAGAGQAGGFIGLLQSQQQIRNQEDNIARLRSNLYRLETGLRELLTTIPANQSQIPSQRLQVAQSRQALVVAEGRLINQRNQYEAQLDTYKGTLGLPPTICIEIEDPMLDQFQLIARQLQDQQKRIDGVIEEVGRTNDKILAKVKEVRDEDTDLPKRLLEWSDDLHDELGQLSADMKPVDEIQAAIVSESLKTVEEDLEHLREAIPRRAEALRRLQKKYQDQKDCVCPLLPIPSIDAVIFDVERLMAVDDSMTEELERLRKRFATYAERLQGFQKGIESLRKEGDKLEDAERFDRTRDGAVLASQTLLTDLRLDVLALELCQARVRTYTIELVPVDVSAPDAMDVASKLRLDLMNARAALVDSWRLIEFNADNLESTLNIVFSGDVTNFGQNPFDLRMNTGRLRAGLQFDAPIVRLSERNTYRQSLIDYQQARRNFYNSLDGLSRGLRSIVRSIETNQFNFEVQRFAVLAAIEQIDLNEDIRVLNEALRQPTGVTAARDSVSALNDLLNAQNDFLSIWINYELQRMWLDLDMGTIQLDNEGYWVDPGAMSQEFIERIRNEYEADRQQWEEATNGENETLPPGRSKESAEEATTKPSRPATPTKASVAKTSPASSSAAKPAQTVSNTSSAAKAKSKETASGQSGGATTPASSQKSTSRTAASTNAKTASPTLAARADDREASPSLAERLAEKTAARLNGPTRLLAPTAGSPAPSEPTRRPAESVAQSTKPASPKEVRWSQMAIQSREEISQPQGPVSVSSSPKSYQSRTAEESPTLAIRPPSAPKAKADEGTAGPSKISAMPTSVRRPSNGTTTPKVAAVTTKEESNSAGSRPTLAARSVSPPSRRRTEIQADDAPPQVKVAPVEDTEDADEPEYVGNQPKSVIVMPAAAFDPSRTIGPNSKVLPVEQSGTPKILRPGTARRIGDSAATRSTKDE